MPARIARFPLLATLACLLAALGGALWSPMVRANAPPVPRTVRLELNRAEVLLHRDLGHLPSSEGIQIVRQSDRVLLRVPARLLFDPDSETLRRDGEVNTVLALPEQLLRRRRRLIATVAVYTDNIGGTAFNQSFAQARAAALVGAIEGRGVAAQRLQALGAGINDALASNDTPEGRVANRRVEFIFERPVRLGRASSGSGGGGQ